MDVNMLGIFFVFNPRVLIKLPCLSCRLSQRSTPWRIWPVTKYRVWRWSPLRLTAF